MSCNRLVNSGVGPYCTVDLQRAHQIARERGPIMPVYWVVRAILQPFFHLYFRLRAVAVRLHGVRQDTPPKMARIEYVLTVDTDEDDKRLALLHENVKRYGTVFNTLAAGAELSGEIRRAAM